MTQLPAPRFRMVIALDLTEYAQVVLEHALDQAGRHDAPDLHFVAVVPKQAGVDEAKTKLAQLVLEGLDTFRDRAPDWHARLHVRVGKAAEEIVDLAAEINAHLIVVGRFGVHHPRRKLGSIAHGVIADAPCPVLTVNLVGEPVEEVRQCPDCVRVRAESDGEAWFCQAHLAPDRESLTTLVPPSMWIGGTTLW